MGIWQNVLTTRVVVPTTGETVTTTVVKAQTGKNNGRNGIILYTVSIINCLNNRYFAAYSMRNRLLFLGVVLSGIVFMACQVTNVPTGNTTIPKVKAVKTLILVRHAQAVPESNGTPDMNRDLTEKGMADASNMGLLLSKKDMGIDQLVTSTAQRALQTTQALCDHLAYKWSWVKPDSNLYTYHSQVLLEQIYKLEDELNTVMIVGHNPAITGVANRMQASQHIPEVPTMGVVAIEFETTHWADIKQENGHLLFYQTP